MVVPTRGSTARLYGGSGTTAPWATCVWNVERPTVVGETTGSRMKRFASAVVAGALVGGVAALVAGAMFEPFALVGPWGVLNGTVLGGIAFLSVVGGRRGWLATAARWTLVVVLAIVTWWAMFFAIGTSPFTLEGAWLWPLAVSCLSALAAAGRWALRSTHTPTGSAPSPEHG